jgi:DNA-(apurinic or apyrimidinic site) lyase
VFHVHLKDTECFGEQVALDGVLDPRSWDDPEQRSWVFRTVGDGNPPAFWTALLRALEEIGYSGELSIENEDPFYPGASGVRRAVEFMNSLTPAAGG